VNTFALEVFDDEGRKCTIYTVRWDGHQYSETDKFFSKFEEDPILGDSLKELATFLGKVISDERGAKKGFFRHENRAMALPPKSGTYKFDHITINTTDFPLRLYCLRLSDSLLILFNGAEKTSRDAQSGETRTFFNEANQFAKKIDEALKNGLIFISYSGREILSSDGGNEIII
jgi:hypothetical protein